jgi:hypothetical protein
VKGKPTNDGHHEACSVELMSKRPAVNKKVSFSSNDNGWIHEFNGETDTVKEVDEGYSSSSSAESEEAKGNTVKRSANGKPDLVVAPVPAHMGTRRVAGDRRQPVICNLKCNAVTSV